MRSPLILMLAFCAAEAMGSDPVRFSREVRPILSDNCFACHGPDEQNRAAELRLDLDGEIDFEEVLARITSDEEGYRMPPSESHKTLEAAEVDVLRRWIAAGAPYEQHWAFVSLQRREPPRLASDWGAKPIDAYVGRRLAEKKLVPRPNADKRTLVRRLTLDLTGLPPTPEEVQDFLADQSDLAYERLVDRLLASPHYGEHMARYWLDLVRVADTNGLHHDHYRQTAPFRDWVIRSFNQDLPFDEFLSWQLAGDLYEHPSDDQLVASGFNRLHLIIDRGTALPEESFHRNVVDRVAAVGTAMLGLTLECAVCHDHKYDPITQRDFYSLYAFFNNFDGGPETGPRSGLDFLRGLQTPFVELPSAEQAAEIDRLDREVARVESEIAVIAERSDGDQNGAPKPPRVTELEAELKALRAQSDDIRRQVPAALVMQERSEPRSTHILVRGEYDQPGEAVERDTPGFLPSLNPGQDQPTRRDLAEWLVRPDHPLTSRVAVNRFWQQLYGVGLVKTSEDFGAQGEPPSHPELLDYLANRFVDSGWSTKAVIREIVLSQTYQQSSHAEPEAFTDDPENRWLARGSRFRLDAEVIRDQALAVSGLLNREMYGPSVKPPQPTGLWKTVVMPSSYPRGYEPDEGDKTLRRSVYTFWRRSMPPPQLTIFDAPTRESCTARRERTNTPLQALVLMNEPQQMRAAIHLASDLVHDSLMSDRERMAAIYELVTVQEAPPERLGTLLEGLSAFRQLYSAQPDEARRLVGGSDVRGTPTELAAWTMIAHSLLNLDETRSRP